MLKFIEPSLIIMVDTVEILVPIITGVAGVFGSWFGTYYRFRREYETKIDEDLRNFRISAYKQIWPKLKDYSKYNPPSAGIDQSKRNELSKILTDWYFDNEAYGLFLSRSSMEAYKELQEALKSNTMTHESIFDFVFSFRTELTTNISGRKETTLRK